MNEDFESFFSKLNQKEMKDNWYEVKKEKSINTKISTTVIVIADFIIIYLFFNSIKGLFLLNNAYKFFPIIFMLIGLLMIDTFIIIICNVFLSKKSREYSNLFKEKVIDTLLKNFFNEVDYIPKKPMPEQIYKEGKYDGYYNRYYSDDYMEGIIDNKYSIKMAEIETEHEETKTDSDGNTKTETTTIFSGLFAKINIGKSINNELRIKQNGTVFKKNRLDMDSEEFEKYFDVVSTNDIVGMQLLTHDVMEILVDYRNLLNRYFDIFIKDNIMYIRLHVGSMFEARINKKTAIDKELVERYYNTVEFIYLLSKNMIKVVEETQI